MPDREYERTHPWLTFRVDLARLSPGGWMLLGEARSKIEHLAGAPLKPAAATELYRVWLVRGALATTAIEGNTLSEDEGRALVEGTLHVQPSREYLAREVQNIVDACNRIATGLVQGGGPFALDRGEMERFNEWVLDGLELDEGVVAGAIRDHSVVVGGVYRGAPARDCEFLLDRLATMLASDFVAPSSAWEMPFAVIKAIVAHVYLVLIHPFGDGNGRTARLIELQTLLAAGFPKPAAQLLSNHYNLTRSEYYRQLANVSRSGGELVPFIEYALQGLVDGLASQLEVVRRQQFADRWEQYVYETFGASNSPSDVRRRRVALDLAHPEPTPVSRLRRLNPEIAEMYLGKTSKTVTRDVNALVELGLIERVSRGAVRPNRDIIAAFLPVRARAAGTSD